MAEITTKIPQPIQRSWQKRAAKPSLRAVLLLWAPATLVAFSIFLPIGYLFIRVFGSDKSLTELIFRGRTLEILGNTAGLAFTVTVACGLIAIPLAWLTTRTDLPLRRLWSVLTVLPLVIPSYVGAYLLVSMFGPVGLLQNWLNTWFGVTRLPSLYGFPGAVLILTLLSFPYTLLSVRAALLGMNPALEEAAHSLGLSAWQVFWRVTFPQMRAGLVAGSLLVSLYVLRDFGAVSFMRYNTFTRAIYVQYQSMFDRSGAAALALVLVLITGLMLGVELYLSQRNPYYGTTTVYSRPPKLLPLGRWRWPAMLFCAAVVGASVAGPAGMLGYWLVRGVQAGEKISTLWPVSGVHFLGVN